MMNCDVGSSWSLKDVFRTPLCIKLMAAKLKKMLRWSSYPNNVATYNSEIGDIGHIPQLVWDQTISGGTLLKPLYLFSQQFWIRYNDGNVLWLEHWLSISLIIWAWKYCVIISVSNTATEWQSESNTPVTHLSLLLYDVNIRVFIEGVC